MSTQFVIEETSGLSIITINAGRAFFENHEEFLRDFKKLMGVKGKKFILDLRHVDYISSLMLSSLVFINNKALEYDGGLALCTLHPKVLDIIKIMCLDKFFTIAVDRPDAIKFLADI